MPRCIATNLTGENNGSRCAAMTLHGENHCRVHARVSIDLDTIDDDFEQDQTYGTSVVSDSDTDLNDESSYCFESDTEIDSETDIDSDSCDSSETSSQHSTSSSISSSSSRSSVSSSGTSPSGTRSSGSSCGTCSSGSSSGTSPSVSSSGTSTDAKLENMWKYMTNHPTMYKHFKTKNSRFLLKKYGLTKQEFKALKSKYPHYLVSKIAIDEKIKHVKTSLDALYSGLTNT